jgi:phage/plasmid-like protein (TIGR03299 family)
MAHELEVKNGKASLAYAKSGGVPWHGLGAVGDESWTLEQWGKEAGVLYTVEKRPNFFQAADGTYYPTGQISLVRDRDNAFYGNASEGWNPIQNAQALEFFRDFVEAGNMTLETVGSLKNGQVMWAMAKVKEGAFTILKKDRIEPYLLFANPHIVGRAGSVRSTSVRVVCANTMAQAMKAGSKSEVRFAHTTKFDPQMVKDALGLSIDGMSEYKKQAEFLAKRRVKDEDVVTYFKRVFDLNELPGLTAGEKAANVRTQRQVDLLKDILVTQPGAELGKGTMWAAFNATTFFMDHKIGKSADARLHSAWFGQNATRKQKAMDLALEMAN